MDYPWHEQQWQQLQQAVARGQLPHAMLLAGVAGLGLGDFAVRLAAWLLCDIPGELAACGNCKACKLLRAGNHPDLRQLKPDEEGGAIRIEAIRTMIEQCQLSSQYGKYKIAIIEPAEAMNRHAADSLLKTLEEPPATTLLILISCQPARLSATLHSRCQRINFTISDRAGALEWLRARLAEPQRAGILLELAGGAPLQALALEKTEALQQRQALVSDLRELRDHKAALVRVAEKWLTLGADQVCAWLLSQFALMAAMRSQATVPMADEHALKQELYNLAAELELSAIISCYQLVLRNRRLLAGGQNINKQGLLEELIAHWQYATHTTGDAPHAA